MDRHKIDHHYFRIVLWIFCFADFSGRDIKLDCSQSFLARSDFKHQMDIYLVTDISDYWFYFQICAFSRKKMETYHTRNYYDYVLECVVLSRIFHIRQQLWQVQCALRFNRNHYDGNGTNLHQFNGHSYRLRIECKYQLDENNCGEERERSWGWEVGLEGYYGLEGLVFI